MTTQRLNHSFIVFENALLQLQENAKNGPVSVKTFLTILSGKGKVFLLILISLFFSQIPIIALPFGLFICYIGIRIALGHNKIWLPHKLLEKTIPSYILKKALNQLVNFWKFMKKWTYPRYPWASQHVVMRRMNGIMIALVGISLAISPPIPFGSMVAFVALFLMGIGLLNDDAVYILLGYGFTLFYLGCVVAALHFFSLSKLIELLKWGKEGVTFLSL